MPSDPNRWLSMAELLLVYPVGSTFLDDMVVTGHVFDFEDDACIVCDYPVGDTSIAIPYAILRATPESGLRSRFVMPGDK